MQLSDDQLERLQFIFCRAEESPELLNAWERQYVSDNAERFEEDEGGEEGYFVTPKMWQIFERIEGKLS